MSTALVTCSFAQQFQWFRAAMSALKNVKNSIAAAIPIKRTTLTTSC